jgi:hypothetical protein
MMVNWGDERLPERFWNKVSPCPMSGCWLWVGTREHRSRFHRPIFYAFKGRWVGARIHAFKTLVGKPLSDKTRPSCGLEDCVNPTHVKFGIQDKRKYKRGQHRLRTYGVSDLAFKQMFGQQNGLCSICVRPISEDVSRDVHVDHDHSTGSVRSLLCGPCNRGLGLFLDRPDLLRTAAAYIEKHAAKT